MKIITINDAMVTNGNIMLKNAFRLENLFTILNQIIER